MSIAYEIAKIAAAHGSEATYDNRVTISKACDMLGEALAGESLSTPQNIAEAIDLLGEYVGDTNPEGNKAITSCGTDIDVSKYATVSVSIPVVELSYNLGSGTGTAATQHVAKGDTVSVNSGSGVTPPSNKAFVGWATTNDAEEPDVGETFTPTANTTLYAVYYDEYTVTYNLGNGTGTVSPVTVVAGESITLDDGSGITAPEGKQFAGWASTNSATEADLVSPYTPESSVTVYAVYEDVPSESEES